MALICVEHPPSPKTAAADDTTDDTPPTLPQELVDAIIDTLHATPSALAACAVVAHAWTPRARRHLFRTLCITPRNRAPLAARLRRGKSDALIAHIRGVKVGVGAGAGRERAAEAEDAAAFALVRALAARTALAALWLHTPALGQFSGAGLDGVTDLTLHVVKAGAYYLDAPAAIAALPRLRRLALSGDTPARELSACPRSRISPALAALVLGPGSRFALEWLQGQAFPALRALRAGAADAFWAVRPFTRAAAASLVRLGVGAGAVAAGQLDFAGCERLECIELAFAMGAPMTHNTFLAGITTARGLARLTRVVLDLSAVAVASPGLLLACQLLRLDVLLVDFCALRAVCVIVPQTASEGEREQVRRAFPECGARRMLSILDAKEEGFGV